LEDPHTNNGKDGKNEKGGKTIERKHKKGREKNRGTLCR